MSCHHMSSWLFNCSHDPTSWNKTWEKGWKRDKWKVMSHYIINKDTKPPPPKKKKQLAITWTPMLFKLVSRCVRWKKTEPWHVHFLPQPPNVFVSPSNHRGGLWHKQRTHPWVALESKGHFHNLGSPGLEATWQPLGPLLRVKPLVGCR